MKVNTLGLVTGMMLVIASFTSWTAIGQAVPDLINYQGLLTDASGEPVDPDGEYTVEFRLWDDATATDVAHVIWGRSFDVVVVKGRFNVILGDSGGSLADVPVSKLADAFSEPERYLQLKITRTPNGEITLPTPIEPRQRILSTPYAMCSSFASEAVNAQTLAGQTLLEMFALLSSDSGATYRPMLTSTRYARERFEAYLPARAYLTFSFSIRKKAQVMVTNLLAFDTLEDFSRIKSYVQIKRQGSSDVLAESLPTSTEGYNGGGIKYGTSGFCNLCFDAEPGEYVAYVQVVCDYGYNENYVSASCLTIQAFPI